MSFDSEPKIANQATGTEDSANAPHAGRTARPLGRGLEDISHLFMRRSTDAPQAGRYRDAPEPERRPSPSGTRFGASLLRHPEALTREQLVATLKECPGALEDQLRVLDIGIPCSPFGGIDLLAIDVANQLTIIDVETSCIDGLLLRGVSHLEWVVQNLANVRRMYQGAVINPAARPRLFLVAPGFSPLLRSAVRHMTGLEINCLRYLCADVSGSTLIFLERVDGEG
jgi:hypothetical protein